jgi:hypothetical protein
MLGENTHLPGLDRSDVHLNDYTNSCRKYRHNNQPPYILEQRRDKHGAIRI